MLRSSLVVTVVTILGMAVSFANQLQIARLFGASPAFDIYLVAVGLPLLALGALSAVLSYSLVPALTRFSLDEGEFGRVATGFLVGFAILGGAIAVLGATATRPILVIWTHQARVVEDAVVIMRVSWINVCGALLLGYLTAVQNVRKRFAVPAMCAVAPYAGMIVSAAVWGRAIGPRSLAYGMLAGYWAAVAILMAYSRRVQWARPTLPNMASVVGYLRRSPLALAATLCFAVYPASDAFWAPRLGTSYLAYLGYSQRLLIALGGLITAGPTAVLAAWLAEAYQRGNASRFTDIIRRVLTLTLFIAAPFAAALVVLRVPIVQLLFQRGAFDARATAGLAGLLPWMFSGMIFMVCAVIVFNALFAAERTLAAAIIGGGGAVVYFALSGLLSSLFGVRGIGAAYVTSWCLMLGAGLWSLSGRFWLVPRTWVIGFQCLASSLIVGLTAWATARAVVRPVEMVGDASLLLRLIIVSILVTAVYLVATLKVFRVTEVYGLLVRGRNALDHLRSSRQPVVVGSE